MLQVGDDFAGYVIDAILGRGGHAAVYRAHRPADPNRVVALKVLDDQHRGSDQTARLRREFEFAHQLDHPHVVTVYDNGVGWLTMEVIGGGASTALPDTQDSTDRAGPDRRRAGLHPSLRNRPLRCQADQYSRFAGLLTRCAHRLRRGVRGRGDGELACHARRGLTAVRGAGVAARQAAVGAHRSVRVGVHRRRTSARQAAVLRRDVDGTGRRASQQPVPSYSNKIAWVPRTFRLSGCTERWRRCRTAGTTRAQR